MMREMFWKARRKRSFRMGASGLVNTECSSKVGGHDMENVTIDLTSRWQRLPNKREGAPKHNERALYRRYAHHRAGTHLDVLVLGGVSGEEVVRGQVLRQLHHGAKDEQVGKV